MSTDRTVTENELINFFKKPTVIFDNIPENIKLRNELCMKARASLILDSYCTTGRFPNYMRSGELKDSGWSFQLNKPVRFDTGYKTDIHIGQCEKVPVLIEFSNFIIKTGKSHTCNHWILDETEKCYGYINKNNSLQKIVGDKFEKDKYIREGALTNFLHACQEEFRQTRPCQFDLCSHITPYNTPEKTCRFFDNLPHLFAPLKLAGGTHHLDTFFDCENHGRNTLEEYKSEYPDISEEEIIEKILSDIFNNQRESGIISSFYEKLYSGWFRQVFSFKNKYGECIMKAVKLCTDDFDYKIIVPATTWIRNNSTSSQLFFVPMPKKQPLYNLDLLTSYNNPVVVLSDSIELADAYQNQNSLPGVVFTSFLCDSGQYDQVDFSPLLKAERVYFLISNHSGNLLESAYLKAKHIADHLKEEYEVDLSFIQVEVDFKKVASTNNLRDYLEQRKEGFATINPDSVILMEKWEDFMTFYERAEKSIAEKPVKFWEDRNNDTEESELVKNERSNLIAKFVVRPYLIKGEVAMLYAGKSSGKSVLALSMAAVATSSSSRSKPLFKEKWWNASKNDYGMHKVLYLDFENGTTEMEQRIKTFADPYWPADKGKCKSNLIIKDMTKEDTDFSQRSNHQTIIDMIESAKNEGCKDQPVDMLIIDTYTKLVRKESPSTPADFSILINKLREMDIAVLILHHENDEGKARGLKTKLDDLHGAFRLNRQGTSTSSLETPMSVENEFYRGPRNNMLMEPFKIRFINGEWQVYEPAKTEEKELDGIVKFYQNSGYDRDAIAKMLGMSRSALFERLKK
ncbi:MAG: AAA family ATPase [Victivallales bacterium]|nr:AAA family ATPase [Victivallales bacterium]